jgi:hypothetical protein
VVQFNALAQVLESSEAITAQPQGAKLIGKYSMRMRVRGQISVTSTAFHIVSFNAPSPAALRRRGRER